MMTFREQVKRFNAALRANGGKRGDGAKLRFWADQLGRINLLDCNGPDDETGHRAASEERIAGQVKALCESRGWRVRFNGDPRGYAVKVLGLKDAYGRPAYNTWGGESDGYGVPEVER